METSAPEYTHENKALSASCEAAVTHLLAADVNFLALDFDLTILSIHTGGAWPGTPSELLHHIRPIFFHLMKAALEKGLAVSIVTFSPQCPVIREVLSLLFPQWEAKIPIRGGDRSWSYVGSGSTSGKQAHMASAVEELSRIMPSHVITRGTTLLIDDDANNIKVALAEGVRAIWLNPKNSDKLLQNVTELLMYFAFADSIWDSVHQNPDTLQPASISLAATVAEGFGCSPDNLRGCVIPFPPLKMLRSIAYQSDALNIVFAPYWFWHLLGVAIVLYGVAMVPLILAMIRAVCAMECGGDHYTPFQVWFITFCGVVALQLSCVAGLMVAYAPDPEREGLPRGFRATTWGLVSSHDS